MSGETKKMLARMGLLPPLLRSVRTYQTYYRMIPDTHAFFGRKTLLTFPRYVFLTIIIFDFYDTVYGMIL